MRDGTSTFQPHLIQDAADLDFSMEDLGSRGRDKRTLFANPEFFDVEYVINPHMAGHIGTVDRSLARHQWKKVVQAYAGCGFETVCLDGKKGLPDLVFTANQSFPGLTASGEPVVILSRMGSEQRVPELKIFEDWYRTQGIKVVLLPEHVACFEGMGDGMWHPSRRLIFGGYGYRTAPEAYEFLSEVYGVPVVLLSLIDPNFYHLDTCLSPLNDRIALVVKEAFEPRGVALIQACFEEIVWVPHDEAKTGFACNGHSPDGETFIVHEGCSVTASKVRALGFTVIECDTSEYLKSGGSVFCMKLMLPW